MEQQERKPDRTLTIQIFENEDNETAAYSVQMMSLDDEKPVDFAVVRSVLCTVLSEWFMDMPLRMTGWGLNNTHRTLN